MGTVVSFAVLPAAPPRGGQHAGRPDPGAAIQAACALLHEADAAFSTWDPRTPLSLAAPRGSRRSGRPGLPGRGPGGLRGGP